MAEDPPSADTTIQGRSLYSTEAEDSLRLATGAESGGLPFRKR